MYAIIDIGSNTIRLNVYQVEEDGAIHSIFQSKETAGLAGYVREDGSMSREGLDRAADALLRFRSILDALHIENRAVFATASLRNITNSEEAVFQLQERTGLMIRLLSGREEAILDYVGATSGMEEREQGMVLDIGGGSTEWVCFSQGRIRHAASDVYKRQGRPWDQPGAGLGSGAPGSASALPLSALHPMRRTGPLPLAQPLQP